MASSSDMNTDPPPNRLERCQSTKEDNDDTYMDLPLAVQLIDCISPYLRRSYHSLPEYIKLCEEYKKHGAYTFFYWQIKNMFDPHRFKEETLIGAYKLIRKYEHIELKAARKAFCTAKAQNYPSKSLKTRIQKHPSYKLHLANSDSTHAYVRCLVDNKDKFLPGFAREVVIEIARAKAIDIARAKLGGILHQNAGLGQVNALRMSFRRHLSDLEAQNEEGQTPLHVACAKDKVKCATILVKAGANLNARDENKDTALHYAARNGNIKIVTLLLESGADVTCKNNKNETPLDLVRLGDHYDEIWKLFQKFAVSDTTPL